MFHKMINYQCPGHLYNLVPLLVSTTNPYHRKRPYERVIPAHKTELYANHSFRQLPNCGTHYLTLYKQILQLAC